MTKIKPCKGRIITNFNRKVLKEESQCIYWFALVTDSVFTSVKNCYSRTSPEESKYKIIEKGKTSKMI